VLAFLVAVGTGIFLLVTLVLVTIVVKVVVVGVAATIAAGALVVQRISASERRTAR
jgi:hypothetical protein